MSRAFQAFTNENLPLPLVSPDPTALSAGSLQALAALDEAGLKVRGLLSAAIADSTRRAYRQDLADFMVWGGAVPSSPEVLARYIADRADTLSPYTITRRIVGISRAHVSQGFSDPAKTDLVRTVLRGVRRQRGGMQRQVAPLLKQDVLAILPLMNGLRGTRDRAMLLLGFAGALRRSELVALDVEDLHSVKEGLLVQVRRSKTDQESSGRKVAIPFGRTHACPVKALERWLRESSIAGGAIFRNISKSGRIGNRLTGQSVALILKSYAVAAGLDALEISGHSLRSGLVTSAAQAGVATHKIQQQSGHRSIQMLARYIRDATLFENNAAGLLL